MQYLTLAQVVEAQEAILEQSGGLPGMRDFGALESALAQPMMCFNGHELNPSLEEKAAALCYSLVLNHPFVDGNKRVGHIAMEFFLFVNGHEIAAGVDDAERTILDLAAGSLSRDELTEWIRDHVIERLP